MKLRHLIVPLLFPLCAAAQSVNPPTAGYKLLWPNGIEPGDASQCEAPIGKTCWWVDANATQDGNGSFASPFNHFKVLEQSVQGGDFVYIRGTFDMATHSPEHQMTLNFYTAAASGTPSQPTTLKSWRGFPRAVFSANRTDAQLRMRSNAGIRVQNIEMRNFGDVGISVDQHVTFAEFINIVVLDGRVTTGSGEGGGLRMYAQDSLHTFIVRNSLFENTSEHTSEPGVLGNNVAALTLMTEATALAGSKLTVTKNIFRDNYIAVRHKHDSPVHMEATRNLIENNEWGFHLRTYSSSINHNVFVNNKIGMVLNNENMTSNHNHLVRYNTFYNNDYLALSTPDWDHHRFHSALHVRDNIFVASATGLGVFYIGELDWNSGTLDRSLAKWTMYNNVFFYDQSTRNFLYSPPPTPEYTKNFVDGTAQFNDTTSILADPMLKDPANGDFSLLPGSPAIGAGSNGTTPGAIP